MFCCCSGGRASPNFSRTPSRQSRPGIRRGVWAAAIAFGRGVYTGAWRVVEIELELALLGDAQGVIAGFRDVLEDFMHLGGALEIELRRIFQAGLIGERRPMLMQQQGIVGRWSSLSRK